MQKEVIMVARRFNSVFLFITKPFHVLKKYPVLYHGHHINIVNFGIFAALDGISILLVFYWAMYAHFGYLSQQFILFTVLIPLFVWGGAKLYYFGALGKKFLLEPMKYIVQTGFYVQGGILGAFIWGIVASSRLDISFFLLADALCLGTFLGQFFGRLGCFNYGCCYGKKAHGACGLHYHNCESKVLRIHPELKDVKLHPTQLYEAMTNLSMFVIMLFIYTTSNQLGLTTVVFFIYQGLVRIVLEFFRGDIYFNNKRNWLTFYASVVSIGVGLILYLAGPMLDASFLNPLTFEIAPSIGNLIAVIYYHPVILGILLIAGVFLFIGYGVHGQQIGYFPDMKKLLKGHRYNRREI